MALEVVGAFAAGVVVGWVARSVGDSTREVVVVAVTRGMRARDALSRMAAQTSEWIEDLIAEGAARYEAARGAPPPAGAGPEAQAP